MYKCIYIYICMLYILQEMLQCENFINLLADKVDIFSLVKIQLNVTILLSF